MTGMNDKISGNANEIAGKAKQAVGDAIDSKQMQAEGAAQEAKGHAQQAGRNGQLGGSGRNGKVCRHGGQTWQVGIGAQGAKGGHQAQQKGQKQPAAARQPRACPGNIIFFRNMHEYPL